MDVVNNENIITTEYFVSKKYLFLGMCCNLLISEITVENVLEILAVADR